MDKKKYLFERASDGIWIFGFSKNSICGAGLYRLDPPVDNSIITIHTIFNKDQSLDYGATFADYLKENGQTYASLEEFLVATTGFFSNVKNINGVPAKLSGSVTRPSDTNNYLANDNIGAATVRVKQVSTITLTGSGGNADITGTGGLTKRATFNTSLTQTAADFVTNHAADYLALSPSVIVTAVAETIVFTAAAFDTIFIAPVITNVAETLGATITHTTANDVDVAQVETVLLTGVGGTIVIGATGGLTKTVTYSTSRAATAIAFVAANLALYDAQGVIVSASGDSIVFTAKVPGTAFTAPTVSGVTKNLAGTIVHVPNVTLSPITIQNAVLTDGGACLLLDASIETNATQFAGTTQRVWLFNATPSAIVGDNVLFVNNFANHSKRNSTPYIDFVFDALLSGSDTVIGKPVNPISIEFIAASGSKNMYLLLQTLTAITAPASGAIIYIEFNALKF